jgi:PAS domain S-box-containing protein
MIVKRTSLIDTSSIELQPEDASEQHRQEPSAAVRHILPSADQSLEAELLSAIVSSSDDAIVSKDLNGVVTSWNSAAERIFGYAAEEMVGSPITKIIPPELHNDETKILSTIASGERIDHFETVRVTKDGQRIEVSLTVSPVKDASGKIVGAAKIARDITQKKKTERSLHTAERLASVGRLAATVAHEINNPLEALTNLIYLARHSEDAKDGVAYLAQAEEELRRIAHLTRQTLGFYRETKETSPIRVGALVASLLPVFSSRAKNKGVKLCSEISGDSEVFAVPGEIRQLIANLISNSIDAVNLSGKIRVRVSDATDWSQRERKGVRLTVADSGAGIEQEFRGQLFEPFFTTKKQVGTGLGLWVCKSIVEQHRGSIRVKSSTIVGRSWTAFSVFLPRDTRHGLSSGAFSEAVKT